MLVHDHAIQVDLEIIAEHREDPGVRPYTRMYEPNTFPAAILPLAGDRVSIGPLVIDVLERIVVDDSVVLKCRVIVKPIFSNMTLEEMDEKFQGVVDDYKRQQFR